MSVFAASSWAAIAAVAHQLEREAVGRDPPVARTLRGFARRLHAARLLARLVFNATDSPAAQSELQNDDTCG